MCREENKIEGSGHVWFIVIQLDIKIVVKKGTVHSSDVCYAWIVYMMYDSRDTLNFTSFIHGSASVDPMYGELYVTIA